MGKLTLLSLAISGRKLGQTSPSKQLPCKNSRPSSFLASWDIALGETSASQRQNFHTDDLKSVRNLVRSSDWSM